MTTKQDYYEVKVKCNNCDKESKVKIPKNQTVKEHTKLLFDELRGFYCVNCKCEKLEPISKTKSYY